MSRMCVCCMHACVCKRETDRQTDRERETERERDRCMHTLVCTCVYMCVCVYVVVHVCLHACMHACVMHVKEYECVHVCDHVGLIASWLNLCPFWSIHCWQAERVVVLSLVWCLHGLCWQSLLFAWALFSVGEIVTDSSPSLSLC